MARHISCLTHHSVCSYTDLACILLVGLAGPRGGFGRLMYCDREELIESLHGPLVRMYFATTLCRCSSYSALVSSSANFTSDQLLGIEAGETESSSTSCLSHLSLPAMLDREKIRTAYAFALFTRVTASPNLVYLSEYGTPFATLCELEALYRVSLATTWRCAGRDQGEILVCAS